MQLHRFFAARLSRTYATRRPEKPPARFPDPLRNSPNARVTPLDGGLEFVHRPPPSAPAPHSTTLAPASPLLRPPAPAAPLPPLLRPSDYRPAPERLSRDDIDKLRALRRKDPALYTCTRLARMFACTPAFVSQVAALPRALRRASAAREAASVGAASARWGERKATVRAVREKRRTFW